MKVSTSFKLHSASACLIPMVAGVLAAPSPATDQSAAPLQGRDQIAILNFDGGVSFQACLPFHDNNLCTVAFVDNPAWGGNAKLYAYDHTCQDQGTAASVSRDALNVFPHGYSFITALPDTIGVYVRKDWDGTDAHSWPAYQGVMVSYDGQPEQALERNLHGLASWTRYTAGDGSSWEFWRAPFSC